MIYQMQVMNKGEMTMHDKPEAVAIRSQKRRDEIKAACRILGFDTVHALKAWVLDEAEPEQLKEIRRIIKQSRKV